MTLALKFSSAAKRSIGRPVLLPTGEPLLLDPCRQEPSFDLVADPCRKPLTFFPIGRFIVSVLHV
jgi:hypothetical protein